MYFIKNNKTIKEKIGKCKYHSPQSWCEPFVTLAVIFHTEKTVTE